jgi:hypothetical protein
MARLMYGIDLEVPWLSWLAQVNDDLLVRKTQLLQHYMCSVCPRTPMVSVKSDLRRISINLSHGGRCGMSKMMSALGDAAENLGEHD